MWNTCKLTGVSFHVTPHLRLKVFSQKNLYGIVLYCIVLYCIVLYCIVLYCIVLYCIVSRNFNEGKARKFTVSFTFCAHIDVIKYRKILTFSFERTQTTYSSMKWREICYSFAWI